MPIADFADYALPLIELLDEPSKKSPSHTTFPGSSDLDGSLRPLYPNEENSLGPMSGNGIVPDESSEAARSAYPMSGIDVLAFYKSFRFRPHSPFPSKWGIFLIDAGVAGLTADLRALEPKLPILEVRQLAMDLLLAHERYHFWVDAWALGQEIIPLAGHKYKKYTCLAKKMLS